MEGVLFDWRFAAQILPDLLRASLTTIIITLLAFAIAMVCGLVLAMMRRSRSRWVAPTSRPRCAPSWLPRDMDALSRRAPPRREAGLEVDRGALVVGSLAGGFLHRLGLVDGGLEGIAQVGGARGLGFRRALGRRWRRSAGAQRKEQQAGDRARFHAMPLRYGWRYATPIRTEWRMASHRWRLDGQTALITGASAGIGLAIARELLGFGADVMLVARDEDLLDAARDDLAEEFPEREVATMAADVADDEERRAILDWVEDHADGLNLLINNAGGNVTKAAVDYTEDEWRGIFETNLFSAFELSRYAHPLLTRHASSAIVNVGSVSGITAVRSGAPYGMTKAALHQMTRNLAAEWAEDGVRVNAVAPWYIRTRRTSGPLSDADYYEEVIARTPMRRIGEPEEVAAAVGFLCLPAASYVTGECIAVDGGFLRYGF